MHVKICGIQTVKEAKRAQQLGADAIGVLVGRVHSSSDFVSPDTAAELCRSVGPFMPTILVTHFEDPASILKLAEKVPASGIQLHSDLPPRTIKSLARKLFPRTIIAKVNVDGPGALHRARQVAKVADAILLDSIDRQANRVGGTGKTHDWTISAQIVRESPIPVVLAGGLTPERGSGHSQGQTLWSGRQFRREEPMRWEKPTTHSGIYSSSQKHIEGLLNFSCQ